MKKIFIILILLFSIVSCKQDAVKQKPIKQIDNKNLEAEKKSNSSESTISGVSRYEITNDTLVPVEILERESKNVFEKYGVEFSGNCYACDLANFKIEKDKIAIRNVCDSQNYLEVKILKFENTENEIKIKTENFEFIFSKIDDAPIYKLEMTGKEIGNENLRISKYFTVKNKLPNFKVHDCGDFDG